MSFRLGVCSWSLHPEEVMGLLLPQFAGNNAGGSEWSNGTYWGRNQTRDNLPTAGVLLLLLSGVAFAGGALRGVRWFLAGLALLITVDLWLIDHRYLNKDNFVSKRQQDNTMAMTPADVGIKPASTT